MLICIRSCLTAPYAKPSVGPGIASVECRGAKSRPTPQGHRRQPETQRPAPQEPRREQNEQQEPTHHSRGEGCSTIPRRGKSGRWRLPSAAISHRCQEHEAVTAIVQSNDRAGVARGRTAASAFIPRISGQRGAHQWKTARIMRRRDHCRFDPVHFRRRVHDPRPGDQFRPDQKAGERFGQRAPPGPRTAARESASARRAASGL